MASFSDDGWFAGFADGEAHFGIVPRTRTKGVGYGPIFSIGLRADDLPVLEALREEFGGSICAKQSEARRAAGQNPQVTWNVGSKVALVGLVTYFDQHPLRSRKAHDYAIWRRAVNAYVRDGYHSEEIAALYGPLMAIRRFDSVTEEPAVVEMPQLRLVQEG